jgi:hypothetical protein
MIAFVEGLRSTFQADPALQFRQGDCGRHAAADQDRSAAVPVAFLRCRSPHGWPGAANE